MSDEFRFELTDEEKSFLKDLVRRAIAARLSPSQGVALPDPPTAAMSEPLGAFVTLKLSGRLRGCIGHLVGDGPLNRTVAAMAVSAAFEDPRFPPLTREEFSRIEVEISILSSITPCPDPELVQVGRHGLLVRQGVHSGLLLPQVAVEWNWDRKTFLDQTCLKAGLPTGTWKRDDCDLFWFEAEVF